MDVNESKNRSRKPKIHDMSNVKEKPRKRSLVERELETSLTEHLTSPLSYGDGTCKSRYGRARRLKTDSDFCTFDKAGMTVSKSPKLETAPSKSPATSPAYKMHASNSQMQPESPKRALENNLENQIENIYNANISLSRFGSNEKKPQPQSPAKKFSKVYTRTDLIQSKEKGREVTVSLIRNIFPPTQSGKKQSNSHLNNILERSSEKYDLSVKPKNGYLDKLSVVKTLDFDTGGGKKIQNMTTTDTGGGKKIHNMTTAAKYTKNDNKEIKRTFTKSEIFDLEAKCDYQVGDIAWARMGTFPFWPCIVTREPDSDMFVKKKMFGKIERDVIHVTFFGDNGRRSWILDSMLRKFQGLAEFETARGQITPETKRKDPKYYAAYMISAKKLPLWHTSIEEAETIQKEPKRLRIDYLNELLWRQKTKVPTPPKVPKSLKISRTDSDVSLSESLFDTLFSEDDGKNDTPQKLRNKSLDVSDVVTACLDNMAAKTGITKIQRQSHMDIWLQKAKSHTPEKGQFNVSITVEKVEKDDAKSKKTTNKDNTSSSSRKKKIVPREVPTQKPYSFRKSTESRHLLSYHNEHDYSKHIDSEISDKSYLNRQAEQSKNAFLVTDNPICVIDKVESLSVGAENQLVNIATEVQEDLITEIVQDQVVTSNKESDKEIKVIPSDKTIEGINQKHEEMKTDSLKKTDNSPEKENTTIIEEISQPSLVGANKSVTDKIIETRVDKITRREEVSNNYKSVISVNVDCSQDRTDVILESVEEKSGKFANLKENSENDISNTSSHSKTTEKTILTSIEERDDRSKVIAESNTSAKNDNGAEVTFKMKDQQPQAKPDDLNISFDDDKTSCNSPDNVQDENEDIYDVVSAIDNFLDKDDNNEKIIDNEEPKKDENPEVNSEATSTKYIDVCTDNNIVLSLNLNKKYINESVDDLINDEESQKKASDTIFLESTINENEERMSEKLLLGCLPICRQSEETVRDDVAIEIKESTKIIAVEQNVTDENKNDSDDLVSVKDQTESVTGTVTKNVLAEIVSIKEKESVDESFLQIGQTVDNKPESKIKMKINLVTKQVVLMQPEERNRNENALKAIDTEIIPTKHKKKKNTKVIKSPLIPNDLESEREDLHPTSVIQMESENNKEGLMVKKSTKKHNSKKHTKETEKEQIVYQTELVTTNLGPKNILTEPAKSNKNENTFEEIVSEVSQINQKNKKRRRKSKTEPTTNKEEFVKDSVSNGVILLESDDSNGHETPFDKVLDITVNKQNTIKSTGDSVSQKELNTIEKDNSSNITKYISEQTCNPFYEVPVEHNLDKLSDRDVRSEFSLGDNISLSSELTNGYTNSSDKDFDPDAVSISSMTSEISSNTELLPRITRIYSMSKKLDSDILQKASDTISKDSMLNDIYRNSKPLQNKKATSMDENVNGDVLQAHMRKIKGMLLLDSDEEESVSSMDDITLSELRRISMHEKTQNSERRSTENTMDSVKSDVSDKKLRLVLTDCLLPEPTENNLPEVKEVSSKTDVEIEIVNSATSPEASVPRKRSLRLRKSQSPSKPKVNGFHESEMPTPEQKQIKQNETGSNEEEEVKIINEPELDSISIISSDSDASVKRQGKKNNSKQKPMSEPEFLKYLEIRQDALMDDHPELTYEEIVAYLYKTWQYEENLKSDVKKDDEIEFSNIVKDITQNQIPKKSKVSKPKRDIDINKGLCKKTSPKQKKLINIEKVISKEKSPKKNHTILEDIKPRELPKRKVSKAFYKEELSDLEDEIELFEIFKSNKKDISVTKIEPNKNVDFVENVEVKSECETAQEDIVAPKTEVPSAEPKEGILNDTKEGILNDIKEDLDELYNEEELYCEQLTIPKPNVFKGMAREKVCEICERPSSLVKCKRCNGMFHVDCERKETKVVEVPVVTRGRKKKKKPKGRKPKSSLDSNDESHSDEKSANTTVENMSIEEVKEMEPIVIPDVDSFETQLEAKMKEIIEKNNVEYDSYSSDDGIDWTETVAGKCEIVDVILKPRSRPKLTDLSDFKCKSCQENETPICFVCKSSLSPKGKVDRRQKCQVAHCHKYYHLECLEHWPQTQFTSGEPSRNNKKIDEFFEPLTCPRHVCHTCVCDDPRGCKTRFSGDKLARCVRCPATYHSFTKCLPAGSEILSASHIVCPRHYQHPPGKVPYHVNTGWCFICALGGKLICCDYCPTSFHADCLNMTPPEGGYMCEDCETGRLPLYGEMVWVKLGHYRWWPGIILHPSEIPPNILAVKHSPGEFVVRFFGQYDHYWVNRGRVFPFQEGDKGRPSGQKSKLDEAFLKAMEHAQRAFEILKNVEPNDEENQDIQSSLLPPHYVKLKVNKPCGSLYGKKVDIEESSLTQCECNPDEEEPCGPYSHCLNRMLLTECGPTCRAGERCQNRAFEKRLYPKLVPYRTAHRGWGLKTLEDIKAGQFVIEYVGELIDEMEFQRRMRRQHETRDENYYYLTLDKERMIDAGPKGNLARFMNHCCEPNCETQKWTVLGDVRVGLFAIHDIPANTEVTFNYNLECTGIEKKQCMCGAKRCSGYIGAKPKQDEPQPKKPKLFVKRTYKKRKPTESPSTSATKPKRPVGRPAKPRELTDIEKDLLIIKNATSGLNSDSEGSGRLSSVDGERKDAKTLKRKRVSFSAEEVILYNGCSSPSVKRLKLDDKSSEFGD